MKVEPVTTPATKVYAVGDSDRVRVVYSDGQTWTFSTYYDWREFLRSQKTHEIPTKDLRSLMTIRKAA